MARPDLVGATQTTFTSPAPTVALAVPVPRPAAPTGEPGCTAGSGDRLQAAPPTAIVLLCSKPYLRGLWFFTVGATCVRLD